MSLLQGVKDVNHRIFGGYAELLRIPHAARFTVGSVIACMPFPMVGMTMTIMTQQYYGNYSLAGALTAVQAIAGAVVGPLLGTLVDRFGQRQVSIPTIVIWMLAAVSFVTCVRAQVTPWILFCIVPFFAAVPPWGAMSRARWTYLMGNDRAGVNRALSLSGVFDEAMWVVGNPLASTLAVISGFLAMSFTGICVLIGALMFLTEMTTCPPSQSDLAREAGVSRKEFREREAEKAKELRAQTAAEDARVHAKSQGLSDAEVEAAGKAAYERSMSGIKDSIWGPGLIGRVRDVVRARRVPVGGRYFDHRLRHGGEHEAVHRIRVRLLLDLVAHRRAAVRREKLDDPAVEALLRVPRGVEHWHRLVPVRTPPVGDHGDLPHYWRMPSRRRGSTATSSCCISCRRPASPRAWRGWAQ